MASFCTKCGAGVSPDSQFCPFCGASTAAHPSAAASASPPVPVPQQPEAGSFQPVATPFQPAAFPSQPTAPPYQQTNAPYQPVAVQPGVATQSSGGGALKIILIVVAVFVVIGLAGAGFVAYTAWRVARAIHVENTSSGSGDKVTIQGNGGSITTETAKSYSADELGTDIYPGARSGEGSMKMDMGTGSMVTGVFVTSDSKDQVLAFYKSRFGSNASVFDTGTGSVIQVTKGHDESVMVTISARSGDGGKTQIAIVHTKAKK